MEENYSQLLDEEDVSDALRGLKQGVLQLQKRS